MIITHKTTIDADGNPTEAVIPWDQFVEIIERLGLDLDKEIQEDLKQAIKDRKDGNLNNYVNLEDL